MDPQTIELTLKAYLTGMRKRLPELYEQVLRQQKGYALVMLWPELADEDDEYDSDEERTSKQRLADRMPRRGF